MATITLTSSSQLKSADTKSEIAHHSGKENRLKYKHANEDIDLTRTHLNVELNVLNRDELLEMHYREKIDKHNENNRGPSRRWDTMDDFLKTFEGKKVKIGGKETKNERWATMSQITFIGNKETMGFRTDKNATVGELWDVLMTEGISEEDIRGAYVEGYKWYVDEHNKKFPTLPIYHSDIHFDETTPHGHDAIVVMGHTAAGNPSDSLNNALGEHYGYANDMNGRKRNLESYRADNDSIAILCVTRKLKELAKENGVEIEFKTERTGQTFSMDMHNYKVRMDEFAEREKKLDDYDAFLKEKAKTLADEKRQRYEEGFKAGIETLRDVAENYSGEEGKYNSAVYRRMPVREALVYSELPSEDKDGEALTVARRVSAAKKRIKDEDEATRKRAADIAEQERLAKELAAQSAARNETPKAIIPKREVEDKGPEL